jgi:hypothetical protein
MQGSHGETMSEQESWQARLEEAQFASEESTLALEEENLRLPELEENFPRRRSGFPEYTRPLESEPQRSAAGAAAIAASRTHARCAQIAS